MRQQHTHPDSPTSTPPRPISGAARVLPFDHLRAFLILLVVAHHAILAYVSFAPQPDGDWANPPQLWRAFPVVDTVRAQALDILVLFNDVVLMALLFLLAGLFTWRGLRHKGAGGFLRGRVLRLGLPFLVGAGLLAPLAYVPAYLQHGGDASLGSFVDAWLSLGGWPSGPAWFLWLLLAFSALAALSYRLAPHWGDALGLRLSRLGDRPWTFFALLVASSSLVYLPVATWVDPSHWFEVGPFAAQTSRVLFYALYFVFGIGLGAHGLGARGVTRGLLAPRGRLARQWITWQVVASVALVALLIAIIVIMVQVGKDNLHPAMPTVANFAFTVSCAASSLMLLSFFLHRAAKRPADESSHMWQSLGRNSYGIYLVHYVYVNWLLLGALQVELPALVKALVVLVVAAGLSWGTSALLRRLPGVARVV